MQRITRTMHNMAQREGGREEWREGRLEGVAHLALEVSAALLCPFKAVFKLSDSGCLCVATSRGRVDDGGGEEVGGLKGLSLEL